MKNTPLFSIIIPCYNYGHFVADSIQSILNQTFDNWECWIIDDGSTDDTAKVVKSFESKDERIHYYYQKNAGLSNARNKGISLSKGDYLQFLDADDLLQKNKLSFFSKIINQNPTAGVLYSEGRLFIENDLDRLMYNYLDLEQEKWTLDISGKGNLIIQEFLKFNRFLVNMPIVKAKLAQKLLFVVQHKTAEKWNFPMKEGNKFIQGNDDWDFWVRAAISGAEFYKAAAEKDTLSLLRLHGGSMSTQQLSMLSSQIVMRSKWDEILTDEALRKNNAKLLQLNTLLYGINLKISGQQEEGTEFIKEALKNPHDLKYSLFALVSLLLKGDKAMKLLKRITGQNV